MINGGHGSMSASMVNAPSSAAYLCLVYIQLELIHHCTSCLYVTACCDVASSAWSKMHLMTLCLVDEASMMERACSDVAIA